MILIVIGIVAFVISLVLWRTWWGATFWGTYDEPVPMASVCRRVYRPAPRRTAYVEEEPPPPAEPPAP